MLLGKLIAFKLTKLKDPTPTSRRQLNTDSILKFALYECAIKSIFEESP